MFSSIMEETKDWKTVRAWRTELKNCATFWRTFEISFQLEELQDRNPLTEEGEELFEWDVETAEQQEGRRSHIPSAGDMYQNFFY